MARGTIRRSITVTPAQDAFMARLAASNDWTRSEAYREVVKRYMSATRFFVDADMAIGHTANSSEVAR